MTARSVRPRALIPAAALATTAVALLWAGRDYDAWRTLGTGGLPPTWGGWLRTTRLRLRKRDPIAIAPLLPHIGDADDVDRLARLPPRRGARPRVGPHPVPHRQLTDHAPEAVRARLARAFDARVAGDPARLSYALSHFEKHNQAVTLLPDCRHCADARRTHGEIGHIHPSDGSMHMVLGASDTRTVIERGWGERHGLAGIALGLPVTYTLIYAPRHEMEVDAVATILDAAIAHMSAAGRLSAVDDRVRDQNARPPPAVLASSMR